MNREECGNKCRHQMTRACCRFAKLGAEIQASSAHGDRSRFDRDSRNEALRGEDCAAEHEKNPCVRNKPRTHRTARNPCLTSREGRPLNGFPNSFSIQTCKGSLSTNTQEAPATSPNQSRMSGHSRAVIDSR